MKHIVITGAADGIGKALATRYAYAGWHVTGIDIDSPRAMQTQAEIRDNGGEITFIIADLSDTDALTHTIERLTAGEQIDIFVHNAGINEFDRFRRSDLPRQEKVIDVNFLAPMLLTAGLLNAETIRHGGTLVFVSSLAHFVRYPGAPVYAATKDGIASYARSLRVALAPQNVHVLTVYPGPTRTEHARRYSPTNGREHRRMAPEKVAELVYKAVESQQNILIPGTANRLFAIFGRVLPGLVNRVMKRTLLDKL